MNEKAGEKKAPAVKFKKVMDKEFAEMIRRFARSYFFSQVSGITTIVWDQDDLAQELTIIFIDEIARCSIPEKVARKHLRWRTLDAIRNLEASREIRRYRYLDTDPETGEKIREGFVSRIGSGTRSDRNADGPSLSDDWNAVDLIRAHGTRRVKEVSISELAEEIQEPENPAEQLRRRFENEGSLWTRKFHAGIEVYLNQLVEEKSRELSYQMVKGKNTIDRLVQWIRENPGVNPTHVRLALEVYSVRESTTRCLSELVRKGVIVQIPVALEDRGKTARTKGRYSYRII